MREIINDNNITLGTCYYPEHWDKTEWRGDILRMLENGIKVIRIAEFAWSKIELTEGHFDYSFFDEFLDITDELGMKVIMGTPTATPPAWLTKKYPETLNADIDGNLIYHGARRQYNYNSPKYRELTAIIVEKMAAHYASRKSIIGWQIDNEINCEMSEFHSESDTIAFRKFLKKRYQTLDELNHAWGTVFWNQTCTEWEQVFVPRRTNTGAQNPHMLLDYYRFISNSAREYFKLQSDILRKYIKPTDFITTNGLFGNLDNHKMTKESLDFITYDSYPNFAYCLNGYDKNDKGLRDRGWSRALTEIRSISENFGIMEQQSGANGWYNSMEAPTPRPGQLTLWTMQSIAHGADYVSYFRWRTCTFGTEIYWHGILDYSGRENRRLREVKSVYDKLGKLQEIAGTKYYAEVGIIKDYDNIFDSQVDHWHGRVERQSQDAIFAAAQKSHTPIDFVYIDENETGPDLENNQAKILDSKATLGKLLKYKVLFYPHASIMTEEREKLLGSYVEKGGKLIIGCRSGYKTLDGRCVKEKLPGILKEITGTDIPEYSLIAPDSENVNVEMRLADKNYSFPAAVFTDLLEAEADSSEVIGKFASDYFTGSGAIVRNKLGDGEAYYYGSAFTEEAAKSFLEATGVISPFAEVVSLPESCEVAVRDGYMFILNYSKEKAEVVFNKEVADMLDNHKLLNGKVELEGYGVKVVKIQPSNSVPIG